MDEAEENRVRDSDLQHRVEDVQLGEREDHTCEGPVALDNRRHCHAVERRGRPKDEDVVLVVPEEVVRALLDEVVNVCCVADLLLQGVFMFRIEPSFRLTLQAP